MKKLQLLSDMKVSTKLTLGFVFVIGMMLIAISGYHQTMNLVRTGYETVFDREEAIGKHALLIKSHMLQCRRNEKDFLLRHDKKYLELLQKNVSRLGGEAQRIKELAALAGYTAMEKEAAGISNLSARYQEAFTQVVVNWEKMGLDHNSGLQGKFRRDVHLLTDFTARFHTDELYRELLFIRRWEKDFLRTGMEKYAGRLEASIVRYEKMVREGHLTDKHVETQLAALRLYRAAWEKLRKGHPDVYEEMRNQAHVMEKAIKGNLVPASKNIVLTIRKHEKDYLLRHDKKYVEKALTAVAELEENTTGSAIAGKDQQEIISLLSAYRKNFLALVSLQDRTDALVEGMREIVHQIEPAVARITSEAEKTVESRRISLQQEAASRVNMALAVAAGSLLLAGGISLLLSRDIIKPLNRSVQFARQLADGDFSRELAEDRRDEIGGLIVSLNAMSARLKTVFAGIADTSRLMNDMSGDLEGTSQQMAAGAEELTSQASAVAAAAEEITANVSSVADTAGDMSADVVQAARAAEQMTANMESVAAAVDEIGLSIQDVGGKCSESEILAGEAMDSSRNSNEKILALNDAAQNVGKVIDMINEITEQTKLLALNATIEAARAGDSGKGFAVVANEVKDLARQTAEATETISGQILDMQTKTGDAVAAIDHITGLNRQISETNTAIARAVSDQNETISAIRETVMSAGRHTGSVSSLIGQLAVNIEEEVVKGIQESVAGVEEVSVNIHGVSDVAVDTSQSAAHVSDSARRLAELVRGLQEQMDIFKLS